MQFLRSRHISSLLGLALLAGSVMLAGPATEGQQRPSTRKPRTGAAKQEAGAATQQQRFKGIFEAVSYPEDLKLQDVFFVSETEGWVSGDKGTILYTNDAGASWTPQMGGDPQSQENRIYDLQFLDAKHGWARGLGEKLLRTTDGQNWEVVNPKFSGHIARVVFTSPNNGVFIRSNEIHRTQDGGKTWNRVFSCALKVQAQGMTQNVGCHLEELHFPTASVGYALSREVAPRLFAVVKTTDGGETWNAWTVESEVGAKDGDLVFLDENIGYALLYGSKLYRTSDGGKTWTGVATGTFWAASRQRISFADREVGLIPFHSNGHHIAWTSDGGKRWNTRPITFPFRDYIYGFSLPSRKRAYVVSDHGAIFRYSVVPASYQSAKAIPAPAMPAGDARAPVAAAGEQESKPQGPR